MPCPYCVCILSCVCHDLLPIMHISIYTKNLPHIAQNRAAFSNLGQMRELVLAVYNTHHDTNAEKTTTRLYKKPASRRSKQSCLQKSGADAWTSFGSWQHTSLQPTQKRPLQDYTKKPASRRSNRAACRNLGQMRELVLAVDNTHHDNQHRKDNYKIIQKNCLTSFKTELPSEVWGRCVN